MKVRWVKLCRWLLGALGISASVSSCDRIMSVEYGQPHMTYSVKGKVVNSKTGAGIRGIEVSHMPYAEQVDTSGADGSFEIHGETWPASELEVQLRDIDSVKYGTYKSSREEIPLKQVEEGSGSWYFGSFTAEGVILKMEEDGKE